VVIKIGTIKIKESFMERRFFLGWIYRQKSNDLWIGTLPFYMIGSMDLETIIDGIEQELKRMVNLSDEGDLGYQIY